MDALQFLKAEHRKASELLARLRAASGATERQKLFIELRRELESDAAVEKEYFYPPLLKGEATAELAGGGISDLDRVQELLARLGTLPVDDPNWRQGLDQLQQALDQHIRNEEELLQRHGRVVLSAPQREDLGERMRAQKLRLIEGGAGSATQDRPREQSQERHAKRSQREPAGGAPEDLAQAAKEHTKGFVEDQVHRLGGQVGGLSRAMRDTAENMRRQPEQAALSGLIERAAGGLERMSDALRQGDVDQLVARSSELVQRQPALFMGGAVMAGFLLTRFLKASEKKAAFGR